MLVTDGADFYDSCPTPYPIPLVRALSAANIKTFIVGAVDPNGQLLYFDASDGPALATALRDVAREVCCGCIF